MHVQCTASNAEGIVTYLDPVLAQVNELTTDLNNWQPMSMVAVTFPQFSQSQLKLLFWKRDEKPGLNRCCRMIGKRLYVNLPVFGLWMAGQLPEQKC